MPPTKYDEASLMAEYLKLKMENPVLTRGQFFRIKSIPVKYGHKKFGRIMDDLWATVRNFSMNKLVKESGLKLGEQMSRVFKVNRAVMEDAIKKIVSNKTDVEPDLKPESYQDALRGVRVGTQGMVASAHLLSGGEPLQEAEDGDDVLDLVDPSQVKGLKGAAKKKRK